MRKLNYLAVAATLLISAPLQAQDVHVRVPPAWNAAAPGQARPLGPCRGSGKATLNFCVTVFQPVGLDHS